MVLDSDTICPPKSIRKLVETAEHTANQRLSWRFQSHFGLFSRSYGIINANLANDYSADDSCTMHMWRTSQRKLTRCDRDAF